MSAALSALLDEMELDAFTEVVNIGVGRAATSLRLMVNDEVGLSVPSVAVVTRDHAAHMIGQYEPDGLVAIRQEFGGDLAGRALLILPASHGLELVKIVVGDELSPEGVIALELEALSEIGNIILNGGLATIANMLQRSLSISLPVVVRGTAPEFFGLADANAGERPVLFLFINFSIRHLEIRGYIALLMDLPGLASLKVLIGELIKRTSGEARAIHVPP